MDNKYLTEKRLEVLKEIKPICEAFKITDYDYEVDIEKGSEHLRIYSTKIGCSSNSTSAIVDELIGYIFIKVWCKNRYLGTFSIQSQNVIKQYWR
jgi:hypothetical protein